VCAPKHVREVRLGSALAFRVSLRYPRAPLSFRRGAAAAVVSALLALGCARRAPAPADCLSLADKWYRSELRLHRGVPFGEQQFEELTRRCLTEPFEAEFVRCVNNSGSFSACGFRRVGGSLESR
jgi:hypothetical protein